jgi:hypothetical protein
MLLLICALHTQEPSATLAVTASSIAFNHYTVPDTWPTGESFYVECPRSRMAQPTSILSDLALGSTMGTIRGGSTRQAEPVGAEQGYASFSPLRRSGGVSGVGLV